MSNTLLKYTLILLGLCTFIMIGAQETTTSRKAKKLYLEGKQWTRLGDAQKAIPLLQKAIETDNDFIEAYLVLADAYFSSRQINKCIETYQTGLNIDPSFYPRGYYQLANIQAEQGLYKQAQKNLETYITLEPAKADQSPVHKLEAQLTFALQQINNPVDFSPVNLGEKINSEFDEYWPSLSADEKTLVLTVLVPKDPTKAWNLYNMQEDFYYSVKDSNNQWTKVKYLGNQINTPGNEGAQSISADGRTMVYTACNRKGGIGSCDLYIAHKKGKNWEQPNNVGRPVNSKLKETQPSLSFDGRTLYFSSNRTGGFGGADIWYSKLGPDGKWQQPINAGGEINTPDDELSPFIHPDDHTLYFSSNGHLGMGMHDIFISVKDEKGAWATPRNLGYPINTYRDEIGLIVNALGNEAYYSSDIAGSRGKDIYYFILYPEARPSLVSYMKGKVYDKLSFMPVAANFEFINLETGELVNASIADPDNGEFLIALPGSIEYMINVSHPGYLFYSEHITIDGSFEKARPFLVDIPLQPITEGVNIVLKNIFYETGKYQLKKQSEYELNKLVEFMRLNPNVRVEISGYTDNIGTKEDNMVLSENRARTVVEYLIGKGINKSRLQYIGYGETEPVASNDTAEGRSKNRRTGFKIVKID